MEALTNILNRSKEIFLKRGVKSVTMDDLAGILGMSKKTLYQCIPSKAKLIERMVHNHIKEEKKEIAFIRAKATNAVDEMILISKYGIEMLREVSPNVIYEIKKYYRESFDKIEKLNNEHMLGVIRQNLMDGIEQGLYRKDLDIETTAQHYVTLSNSLVNEDIFPKYFLTIEKTFIETLRYHLRAITTPTGWEQCQKQLSKLIKE